MGKGVSSAVPVGTLRVAHPTRWNLRPFSGLEIVEGSRLQGGKPLCRKRSDMAGRKPRNARHARKKPPTKTRASFFSDSGIRGSTRRSDTNPRPRLLPTRTRSGGGRRSRPHPALATGARAETTRGRTRRRSGWGPADPLRRRRSLGFFFRLFLGQCRVHPDPGKVDELIAQLRRLRPPGQADAFARIVVILLGFRQDRHLPTSRPPSGSRTQFAESVGAIRDSWPHEKLH